MSESAEPSNKILNPLTLVLIVVIAVAAVIVTVLSPYSSLFQPGGNIVVDLLQVLIEVIYLIGGGILTFGALAVTVRFVRSKLKEPYRPAHVSQYLSGYLTLSLEFFIGAEIIRTVVARDLGDIELLFLIILSRGLFSFIIYLDRRWHEASETE